MRKFYTRLLLFDVSFHSWQEIVEILAVSDMIQQSTPLNLNRKYSKILFELHDHQIFRCLNKPFSSALYSGEMLEYGGVFTLPVFT